MPGKRTEPRILLVQSDQLTKNTTDYLDITSYLYQTDENGLLKKDAKGDYYPTDNKLVVEKGNVAINGKQIETYLFKVLDKDDKLLLEYKSDPRNIAEAAILNLPLKDGKPDFAKLKEVEDDRIFTTPQSIGDSYSLSNVTRSLENAKSIYESKSKDFGRAEFTFDKYLSLIIEDVVLDSNKFEKRTTSFCSCASISATELGSKLLTAISTGKETEILSENSPTFAELNKFAKKHDLSVNKEEVEFLLELGKGIVSDGKISEEEKENFGAVSAKLGFTDSGITDAAGKRKTGWMVE